jgi:hypothetical protein
MKNNHPYNGPLTEEELENALHECKGSSPGPDKVHHEFLKRWSQKSGRNYSRCTKKIWSEGEFPKEWRRAMVISILKPEKTPTNPCRKLQTYLAHKLPMQDPRENN